MRKPIPWILGLLVSAVALWLAFRGVSLADMTQVMQQARYAYVAPALLLVLAGQWFRAQSWRVILGHGLPRGRVFSALNAGYLLNNVLPLRLGELGRAYLISRTRALSAPQALSSVLVERVIDLCMVSGILLALLPAIAFEGWVWDAALASVAVVGLGLAGLYTVLHQRQRVLGVVRWGIRTLLWFWPGAPRLETMASAFIDGMQALQQPGRFLQAALFSGLAWLSAGASVSFILLAFMPLTRLGAIGVMGFFTLAVTALTIALPSAPGSLGVWQWAVVLALSVFGVAQTTALSVALVHHLANYGVTSLLGAVALAREGETLGHLAQSANTLVTTDDRRATTADGP